MATTKQKLALDKIVENGGNIGKAMIAAGYSPATAKTPQKLTKTKGWKELMSKNFSDDNVMKQHLFLINQHADLSAKTRAIDLYYKLKGRYATDKHQVDSEIKVVNVINYGTKETDSNSGR